ncbi:MAG: SDR family NAD(P)-dependent oxidoreductase [Caulobacteraceae bacterium]|nr:SDR family NAD(P)-dependent oxidoreductase [Caulobacteraceae bacterium]
MNRPPKNVLITGASSGLGRALALQYATDGASVALLGRNTARLTEVARAASQRGASVCWAAIDLRDRAGMRDFLLEFDAANPIDCLIASAGITMVTPKVGDVEDLARASDLFEVNLGGLMNTLAPVAPRMRARRSGQIALFSSVAAFAPPPDSPSYAASKAAVLAFGLATRALYRRDGVSVSVICPGFIDTPMTASYSGWKPMLMPVDAAACRIRRGLDRRRAVIAFPLPLYWAARLQWLLPESLRTSVMLSFRAFARESRVA